MKRLTLLTILLVVVGLTAGFAAEVKPTISTLSGSGTLSWGIDLDNIETGFQNSMASDFALTFVADGSDTHKGSGDWYGEITLSGIHVVANDVDSIDIDAPGVAAKIVGLGGMIEIGVYGAPGLTGNAVTAFETAADLVLEGTEAGLTVGDDFAVNYGTYIGFTVGPVAAKVKVVSDGDWTNVAADQYAFGADGTLTVTPIVVGFGAYENLSTDTTGFYVDVAAAIPPISAYAGFDGQLVAGVFAFDADFGLTFTLLKDTTIFAGVVYGDNVGGLDAKVQFAAGSMVPGLGLTLTGYILDITTVLEYEVIADLNYTVALSDAQSLKPYATVKFGDDADVNDMILTVTAGVEAKLIPLTTFKLEWATGNLFTPVLGTVIFSTTVTY